MSDHILPFLVLATIVILLIWFFKALVSDTYHVNNSGKTPTAVLIDDEDDEQRATARATKGARDGVSGDGENHE